MTDKKARKGIKNVSKLTFVTHYMDELANPVGEQSLQNVADKCNLVVESARQKMYSVNRELKEAGKSTLPSLGGSNTSSSIDEIADLIASRSRSTNTDSNEETVDEDETLKALELEGEILGR